MHTFKQIVTGKWDAYKVSHKTPSKIQAVKFELYRAEGPSAQCGPAQPVTTWTDADDILRNWARTAPDEGQGYDKCDFTVTWSDGETYTGRYDLRRHDMGFSNLLARHIRQYIEFLAGTHRPEWMTAEQYEQALQGTDRQACADFLAKYEIGNSASLIAPVMTVAHDPKPEPTPKTTKQRPAVSKQDAKKVIELRNMSLRWTSETYNADILPGKWIRIFGNFKNRTAGPLDYDITFEIGDTAEYDSYNLIYTGEITNIGAKTVTIKHPGYSSKSSRLTIAEFADKNWDFDLERIAKHNHEESYYI